MKQYLDLCNRILKEGKWVTNERTGKRCLTVINADFAYDVKNNQFPLVTVRKAFYKSAIAELLGYLRGYSSAAEFRALGTKTWDANANENASWLANHYRKGVDDMGRVYGVQGRAWRNPNGQEIDQLAKVVKNLTDGKDDRGEIITFWNPGEFDRGCLRPCMHSHQFSVLDGELYLNSTQRSCDVPLGLVFNMPQVFTLLALMSQITGIPAAKAYHKVVNAHIYEDQLPGIEKMLERKPFNAPQLIINPNIASLHDLETWVTTNDFTVEGYSHHEPIEFPFAV